MAIARDGRFPGAVHFSCIAVALWAGAACMPAAAFELPGQQRAETRAVIDLAISCRFDSALTRIDISRGRFRDDAMPSFLTLTVLGLRELDFNRIDAGEFDRAFDRARTAMEAHENRWGVSSYSLTLRGCIAGMRASQLIRRGNFFAGARNGFHALDLMQQACDMDTANADVDFFLGLAEYAKGELRKRMWWVLFWYPGDKTEGMSRLRRCIAKAQFTGAGARLALTDIYTREGLFDSASTRIEELEKKYPRSRFVHWSRAKYFRAAGKPARAADIFARLAGAYAFIPEARVSYLIVQNHRARMLKLAGDNAEACRQCRQILDDPRGAPENILQDTERLAKKVCP